jgi:hypothetical protein
MITTIEIATGVASLAFNATFPAYRRRFLRKVNASTWSANGVYIVAIHHFRTSCTIPAALS